MRTSHSVFFSLFIPALFSAGCSNIGSSTGLASEGDDRAAADKSAAADSVSSSDTLDPSDSLKTAMEDAVVPPASDTGNAEDTSSISAATDSAEISGAVPTVPAVDSDSLVPKPIPDPDVAAATPGADTAKQDDPDPDSANPVVEAPVPDSTPVVAVSVPETDPLAKPVVTALAQPTLLPAANTAPAYQVFLNTDFESESQECWNGNRTATAANSAGCGPFKSIGFTPFSLGQNGITHSGSKAIDITYSKNEEMGGTNVGISADSVNVRAWYYFEPGFDFGQGMKIGRVSSFNKSKQLNDVDIILEVRSSGGKDQCGVTDMADVGLFFNGAPKGYDWGHAAANISFERGRWYAVEYQVVLNNPGRSDGAVRLWVDGRQVAARSGLNIRGTAGMDSKLNTVKIGGWYSNGAHGNSKCAHPSQPSKLHMDDVAIATSYIGMGDPNTVAAR